MSLRFPLVFWNEPPTLSFTSCIITSNKERILTGTHGGLCVLWVVQKKSSSSSPTTMNNEEEKTITNMDDEFSAEPFAVLYGHESRVTDMAECIYDFAPSVCSGTSSLIII
jgi:hypothetical protein